MCNRQMSSISGFVLWLGCAMFKIITLEMSEIVEFNMNWSTGSNLRVLELMHNINLSVAIS